MQAEDRYLRVYCLTHGVSFTALDASTITCESGGEALAHDFPREDYWEYCCDCQSFWPSALAKGAKAQELCPVCSRANGKRYVCDYCKVISLDSNEQTKRKAYTITATGSVQPSCPGCSKSPAEIVHRHQCEEIGAEFSTASNVCPFCQEQLERWSREVEKTLRLDDGSLDAATTVTASLANGVRPLTCPQCDTVGTSENRFCKQCGYPLKSDVALQNPALGELQTTPGPTATPTIPSLPHSGTTIQPFDKAPAATAAGYPEPAPSASITKPLLVAALVFTLLVIGILSALLLQANNRTGAYANVNPANRTTSFAPTPVPTTNAAKKSSTPVPTPSVQATPVITQSGPTANARLAYCRSNNVYVRSSPYLDESKVNVIKVINRSEKMWVLSTSTNYDTTYIRSAGGNVTDNWTEVQLYDDASIRGWVFSYFVQY